MRTAISMTSPLALVCLCRHAPAATIFVPFDQPTIQAAIDVAMPGDVIEVFAGTYTELIDFGGEAITVKTIECHAAHDALPHIWEITLNRPGDQATAEE